MSSFLWGIGKATALTTLGKNKSLHLLGSGEDMNEIIAEAMEFIATCYGCKEKLHMSDV
jgi:hypothetical protein